MATTKPKAQAKKSTLAKNGKRQKILIGLVVLLFAAAGGLFVYKSQAATHVTTRVYRDIFTDQMIEESPRLKKFDMPSGKTTKPALWVKKSSGRDEDGFPIGSVTISDGFYYGLEEGSYTACFELYNSKDNKLEIIIWEPGDPAWLVDRTIYINGKTQPQTHCINFEDSGITGDVSHRFRVAGIDRNFVVHKLTIIKR